MINQILVLDGDEDIVSMFHDGLLELGMLPIDLDVPANFEDNADFPPDSSRYTFDPSIFTAVAALMGSGGFVALIKAILDAQRGEGTIDFDEQGNIIRVTFKNIKPGVVAEMLAEISRALKAPEHT